LIATAASNRTANFGIVTFAIAKNETFLEFKVLAHSERRTSPNAEAIPANKIISNPRPRPTDATAIGYIFNYSLYIKYESKHSCAHDRVC
jgi:hypothetical protein